MICPLKSLNNENGSAIVIALMLLSLLHRYRLDASFPADGDGHLVDA